MAEQQPDTRGDQDAEASQRRARARQRLAEADQHWTDDRLDAAYEEHDRRLNHAA